MALSRSGPSLCRNGSSGGGERRVAIIGAPIVPAGLHPNRLDWTDERTRDGNSAMLRLIVIGVLLALFALGGMFARRIYVDNQPPRGTVTVHVGSRSLSIDRAMLRNPDLTKGGAVNRLDLVLRWPDMAGAGGMLGRRDIDLVFVTIEDAAASRRQPDDIDPADRPAELYARFVEPEATTTDNNLIARRFRKGTPYEGEDLFLATPDEREFAARCPVPGTPGALAGDLCLWQVRLEGLELHARFQPRYLADWPLLASRIRALATTLGGVRRTP